MSSTSDEMVLRYRSRAHALAAPVISPHRACRQRLAMQAPSEPESQATVSLSPPSDDAGWDASIRSADRVGLVQYLPPANTGTASKFRRRRKDNGIIRADADWPAARLTGLAWAPKSRIRPPPDVGRVISASMRALSAGQADCALALAPADETETVVLDFIRPRRPGRHRVGKRRKAWLNEAGRVLPVRG